MDRTEARRCLELLPGYRPDDELCSNKPWQVVGPEGVGKSFYLVGNATAHARYLNAALGGTYYVKQRGL